MIEGDGAVIAVVSIIRKISSGAAIADLQDTRADKRAQGGNITGEDKRATAGFFSVLAVTDR